jgi:hypothetical protein
MRHIGQLEWVIVPLIGVILALLVAAAAVGLLARVI